MSLQMPRVSSATSSLLRQSPLTARHGSSAALLGTALLVFAGCAASETSDGGETESAAAEEVEFHEHREAYFGDVHVHTRFSFDAFIFGTKASPDDAYVFAKGGGIQHPAGFEMKLDRPLDFQGVSDHAMYLGMLPEMTQEGSPAYDHPIAQQMRDADAAEERRAVFVGMAPYLRGDEGTAEALDAGVVRTAWSEIVDAAERHNDPGTFTTFIAYEYTSGGGANDNLHRNVVFRGSEAPPAPFGRLESSNPEDLWETMDAWRAQGMDALAIPHNSNGSGGRMFEMATYEGGALDDAYAQQRMRNEPIVEVTQVKGTSETHPALSPNDEWANFEIMPYKVATTILSQPEGSYVRDAYRRGLALEEQGLENPYKFGLIGSSDTHVAAGSFSEENYWSKVGILDAEPMLRGSVPGSGRNQSWADAPPAASDAPTRTEDGSGRTFRDTYYYTWGASGLAGVWAQQNTREAIFDAMRRKETFATSGSRIKVRFFAGPFEEGALDGPDFLARAYAEGVPMGGDLGGGAAPSFAVWAVRDALGAPLDRVQVVKGWAAGGTTQEQVFDVACSGGAAVDPATNRCPDNGATVDLATCEISADAGSDELKAVWNDPTFDPSQRAFYYVRVLENPTCRWSTWDALREGVEPRRDVSPTIRERAWSSPIWFTPEG